MAPKILVSTGSGSGLLQHQAITWTNVDLSPMSWVQLYLTEINFAASAQDINPLSGF